MEPSTLLETTKTAFSRLQAAGRRFNYPQGLKDDAIKLLMHYSESTLSAALGITRVSLRNWHKEKNQKTTSSPTFMRLDIDELDESVSRSLSKADNTVTLTVNLPHQLSLSLPEQPVKKAVYFVCTLIKEFDTCLL